MSVYSSLRVIHKVLALHSSFKAFNWSNNCTEWKCLLLLSLTVKSFFGFLSSRW